MTALIVLAIIFGSIIAYLGTGTFLAAVSMRRFWSNAELKHGGEKQMQDYGRRYTRDKVKDSVKEQTLAMVLGWPVASIVMMIINVLNGTMLKHDPEEIKRREKEREEYVAKLEKELGVNQPKNFSVFDLLTRADFSKLDAASRQAYLNGRQGFTDMFLEDVEDYPHDMLARTIAEMRSARGLPRNYTQDDLDDYTDRIRYASKRWLGDV